MDEQIKETREPQNETREGVKGTPREAIIFKIGILKGLANSAEDADVTNTLLECQQIYNDILQGRLRFVPDEQPQEVDDGEGDTDNTEE